MISLSLVLPVMDEEKNLRPLYEEIVEVFKAKSYDYEIIFVDDGSQDRSREIISELGKKDPAIKGIFFRRNFGQTAAMSAGIDFSSKDIIFLMDADRQNDPRDIPAMLERIEQGDDVVVGWRKNRKDKAISRKLPSMLANWLIRKVGGVEVNDLGCSLKGFRSSLIKEVKLYGEMHRFIPLYTKLIGGRLSEVVVNHRERVAGKTKYGLGRTFNVILDLVTVKFFLSYGTKPMYFFGKFGLFFLFLSAASTFFLFLHKFLHQISIVQSPLLILFTIFMILGVHFILMGVLAEIQIRIYYESQHKKSYYIKSSMNI